MEVSLRVAGVVGSCEAGKGAQEGMVVVVACSEDDLIDVGFDVPVGEVIGPGRRDHGGDLRQVEVLWGRDPGAVTGALGGAGDEKRWADDRCKLGGEINS